jgi:membrane-bound ClpP family serine protease
MFCGECGTQNPDTNQFCKNCGKHLRRPQQAPVAAAAPAPAPAAPVQPVQPVYYQPQPAGMQQPGVTVAGAAAAATPQKNTGMLVLGIVSVIAGIAAFFFYPYILGALAIVLGGISVFVTRKKTGKIAFIAIIGIVIGIAAILVDNFYFVLFPPKELTFDLLFALF